MNEGDRTRKHRKPFESGTFDRGQRTFPNGCHVIEVEIDDATDAVSLVRYHAVEDVGHMINPLLVAGRHCEPKTKQSSSAWPHDKAGLLRRELSSQ